MSQTQWTEQLKVEGQHLVEEVKKLYNEGNVRHLVIMHEGHTILEIPVVVWSRRCGDRPHAGCCCCCRCPADPLHH